MHSICLYIPNKQIILMQMSVFYLFFCLLSLAYHQSVIYNITISNRTSEFESNFFLSLLSTEPLCFPNSNQRIAVQFDPCGTLPVLLSYYFITDSRIIKNHYVPHEPGILPREPETFQIRPKHLEAYKFQKMISGLHSTETIKFGQLKIKDWHFYLGASWVSELKYASIGLSVTRINKKSYHYFINHLYDNDLIAMRQYCIEFKDRHNGRVIFGDVTIDKQYKRGFDIHDYTISTIGFNYIAEIGSPNKE